MSKSKSTRWTVGRIIRLILLAAATVMTVSLVRSCYRERARLEACQHARPMELAVDLSEPGEYAAPYHQTCAVAHGAVLALHLDPALPGDVEVNALLKPLTGQIRFTDIAGQEMDTTQIDGQYVLHLTEDRHVIELGWLSLRVPDGEYMAHVRAERGVAGLAGYQQTLFVRYHLCGMESLPVLISGVMAGAAGFVALILAAFTIPVLLLKPRAVSDPTPGH
jgi:hypothetical protein